MTAAHRRAQGRPCAENASTEQPIELHVSEPDAQMNGRSMHDGGFKLARKTTRDPRRAGEYEFKNNL